MLSFARRTSSGLASSSSIRGAARRPGKPLAAGAPSAEHRAGAGSSVRTQPARPSMANGRERGAPRPARGSRTIRVGPRPPRREARCEDVVEAALGIESASCAVAQFLTAPRSPRRSDRRRSPGVNLDGSRAGAVESARGDQDRSPRSSAPRMRATPTNRTIGHGEGRPEVVWVPAAPRIRCPALQSSPSRSERRPIGMAPPRRQAASAGDCDRRLDAPAAAAAHLRPRPAAAPAAQRFGLDGSPGDRRAPYAAIPPSREPPSRSRRPARAPRPSEDAGAKKRRAHPPTPSPRAPATGGRRAAAAGRRRSGRSAGQAQRTSSVAELAVHRAQVATCGGQLASAGAPRDRARPGRPDARGRDGPEFMVIGQTRSAFEEFPVVGQQIPQAQAPAMDAGLHRPDGA